MGLVIAGGSSAAQTMPDSVVAPFDPRLAVSFVAPGANAMLGIRVICRKAGTLHNLTCGITTSSGNLRVAVYDTGNASAGVRTRLYDSGSVASPGTGWRIIGDPAIAVTKGQQLDLGIIPDNGTLAVLRGSVLALAAFASLPTGFWPTDGAVTPRMDWILSPGSFTAPATIADGSLTDIASPVFLMATIT